jgi:hypothetical protein
MKIYKEGIKKEDNLPSSVACMAPLQSIGAALLGSSLPIAESSRNYKQRELLTF